MAGALILSPSGPGRLDGVGDYSFFLACALQHHLPTTLMITHDAGESSDSNRATSPRRCSINGWNEVWRLRHIPPLADSEVILLQYIPARYFPDRHLGWLLLWLAHARFRQRKKLILTVHEYNVAWALSPKRILGRLMLDLLACLLGALSHRIVVTHGYNQRSLRRLLFWKKDRVSIIPVGSNIPYSGIRDQGSGIRGEEEGTGNNGQRTTGSGQLTLTMFGQPAGMDRQVLISLGNWVSAHQRRVRLRWVGRSRREILDVWVGQCGLAPELLDVCDGQPAEAISQLLRSSDVFLAPLVDGVSTRRTTVIAALNHGLPVVGTDGPCTDSLFRGDPSLLLSDCGDARTFMQHVESVLSDESQRRQMRQSAQDFFARFFTWDRIAEEYRKLLGA